MNNIQNHYATLTDVELDEAIARAEARLGRTYHVRNGKASTQTRLNALYDEYQTRMAVPDSNCQIRDIS